MNNFLQPAGREDERVAVVVVHGIADQQPGQTVRELARLLCHGSDGPPRYVQGELCNVLIPVTRLEPGMAPPETHLSGAPASSDHDRDAGNDTRRMPGTPSGFFQTQQQAAGSKQHTPLDLGTDLNDYLLERLEMPESDALYESTRISLRRRENNCKVDFYEMYWADLSRLGSGGWRSLYSLYQLFFHLSMLAADVVDHVSLRHPDARPWRLLQRLHAWMAWLMRSPAVLVQLCMMLVVLFGAASSVPDAQHGLLLAVLFGIATIVMTTLASLAWLHAGVGSYRWLGPVLLMATAVACFATAVHILWSGTWPFYLYVAVCVLLAGLLGTWLVERYARVTQGVRLMGHLLVVVTVVLLCEEAWRMLPQVTTLQEWMLTTALRVGELLLAALLLVWFSFVSIQIAALLLGLWLGRTEDSRGHASLHTARVALVVSSGLFMLLSLVLWSVLNYVAGLALGDLAFSPLVFGDGYYNAALWLDGRVLGLGGFFTPLVFALMLLGVAALLVLLPSLMEELAPRPNTEGGKVRTEAAQWSRRLGTWVVGGMRRLDRSFRWLVPLGAIGGGVLYLAFVFQQFAFSAGIADGFVQWLDEWLALFQGEALVSAGKWLAGGALTISALGARFRQTFGRLRVVIDAILDVDNYFGDPPNRQPSRARIFSRYASLLCYLRDKGYGRIVIVAHSQGTVISAELLRHLHVQGRLQAITGRIPLTLVTLGSPLRDLYARRFPLLYEWMGGESADFAGAVPAAADIGVREWVNACRSGDYVGRFIWTPLADPERFDIATVDVDGRVNARRNGDRSEFCLGAGAHTHYFSNDAFALAAEIDRLIAGDGVGGSIGERARDGRRSCARVDAPS